MYAQAVDPLQLPKAAYIVRALLPTRIHELNVIFAYAATSHID